METLEGFIRKLGKYQALARGRDDEYLNTRFSDTPFETKVLYEMMMEFSDRLAKIEKVMEPAPEEVKDEEADALEGNKPKFY